MTIKYPTLTKKLTLLFATLLYVATIFGQSSYWSKDFADAIIDRYADINDLTNKGWEYSNSIVLIGIEQLYYETGNEKYLSYIKKHIDKYVDENGNISFDKDANNLDHLHPGWLCITLYEELGEEKYKKAAENIRFEFNNQPRNSQDGFWHKQKYENQMWADGIYMAEPFLIRYGSVFNDLDYCANEATEQTILIANNAYDSTKNLILHGWDETKQASWVDPATGKSPEVWSRGMGWYCMALVDILDYLPKSHKDYNRLIEILQGLAIGIKNYQDAETGLWYQVVDKGHLESNWHETSGSSMFVYSLKKAIDKKYIDSATYMPTVQKGWQGIQTKISLDSKGQPIINDFVRGMGIKDSYDSYVAQEIVSTPDSRYPHGYCGILLAAAQMEFPLPKFFTLSISNSGQGEVSLSSEQDEYKMGTNVILTATPNEGWEFSSWAGSIESAANPLNITMDSSMQIEAVFTEQVVGVKKKPIKLYCSVVSNQLSFSMIDHKNVEASFIINVLGRTVYQNTNKNIAQTIDVAHLNQGMYFLIILSEGNTYTSRFIKN